MKLTLVTVGCALLVTFVMVCLLPSRTDRHRAQPFLKDTFSFKGQPIHPGCINELLIPLADTRPLSVTVDVGGIYRSNKYHILPTVRNGIVSHSDRELFGRGYIEYEHLGLLENGMHVLRVSKNTGGSGVSRYLLIVQFEERNIIFSEGTSKRLLLSTVGCTGIGNHDDGKILIEGNEIIIGESKHRPMEWRLDLSRESLDKLPIVRQKASD